MSATNEDQRAWRRLAEDIADRALMASGCGTKNHVWEETGAFGKARCTVCRLERMNLYPRERLVPRGIGMMA